MFQEQGGETSQEPGVRHSVGSVAERDGTHLRPLVVVLAGFALLIALAGLAAAVAARRRQLAAWSRSQDASPRPKTTRAAWLFLFGGLGLAVAVELVVFNL